jgi:hypothetical protein
MAVLPRYIDYGNVVQFDYTSVLGEQKSPSLLVLENDEQYIHGVKLDGHPADIRVLLNSLYMEPNLLLDSDDFLNHLNSSYGHTVEKYYRKYVIENIGKSYYDFSVVSKPYALTIENYINDNRDEHVELVDTNEIYRLREFDRDMTNFHSVNLLKDIMQYGITSWGIINFQVENNVAYIVEGNHRLQAAINFGIRHMPMKVYVNTEGTKWDGVERGVTIKDSFVKRTIRENSEYGTYYHSNVKPSELGFNILEV